mgnify:CR=1 FL=1
MSHAAEKWARAQTVGNATAKAVLKELAFRLNGKDGLCCPSLKTLCIDLEIKKRDTVLAAVQRLEALGLIAREIERSESGEILRTLYSFPTFVPSEWEDRPKRKVSRKSGLGIPKNGTPYPENRETVSQKSGDRYPENRDVTGKLNMETEPGKEQVIKASPSDDLVLSPDSDIRPWAEVDPDVRPCSAVDPEVRPWSESPAPKHTQKNFRSKTTVARPDDVGEQVWEEFLILRQQKKKTFTDLALQGMRREAKAAGLTLEEAMTMSIERGWQSFQAKYVRDNSSNGYRSKRQPTCPGDWEKEYKGVDYTRGAVMKEFTPEESAELNRICEELGF